MNPALMGRVGRYGGIRSFARWVQEIREQVVPVLGQDRLRVELYALHRRITMAHPHDLAVFAFGGDVEARRQIRAIDHERMIAGRGERARQPDENAFAAMCNLGKLSVHGAARTYDRAADGRAVPWGGG